MKGSAVVLIGCLALFCAAPSQAYSVKFISEDDQVANRQDTQSGTPSGDVATTSESLNSDTDESKTIKMEDNVKPAGESVPGDIPAEKSKIRKRHTRSLDIAIENPEPNFNAIDKQELARWFEAIWGRLTVCFTDIIRLLQSNEVTKASRHGGGQRSTDMLPDIITELLDIIIKIENSTSNVGGGSKNITDPWEDIGFLPGSSGKRENVIPPRPNQEQWPKPEVATVPVWIQGEYPDPVPVYLPGGFGGGMWGSPYFKANRPTRSGGKIIPRDSSPSSSLLDLALEKIREKIQEKAPSMKRSTYFPTGSIFNLPDISDKLPVDPDLVNCINACLKPQPWWGQ